MLAKILKGNRNFIPAMILILFGIGFLLLNLPTVGDYGDLLAGILFITTLIHSALIINKFPYFRENFYFTFLISIHFLLIYCCLDNLNFFAGFLLLMIVLAQLLFTYQKEIFILNGFDLGFFTAVAIAFQPSFWIFGIFLIVSNIFKGKTEIRFLIITVLGILAVALLAFEIMAVWDLWFLWDWFKEHLNFNHLKWQKSYFFLLPLIIPPLLGLIDYYRNINRQSANKKVVYFDTLLFAAFALIHLILYGGTDSNALLLLTIPAALLASNFLTYSASVWYKEIMIWGVLICLLLYRFHAYIELPAIFDQVTF